MVSFIIFVKAMPPCLSELKVLPSFCFAFKIPDDVAASTIHTTSARPKVSILGVEALWGDYRDIPTDQGSLRSVNFKKDFLVYPSGRCLIHPCLTGLKGFNFAGNPAFEESYNCKTMH